MNENNKSFYPSNMFEFIHHPEYGCRDFKGLKAEGQGHTELEIGVAILIYTKLCK
jgi:hypothetical protein